MQKFILWALPRGETDSLFEHPLTSFPLTRTEAGKVQRAAVLDGWHGFRLAQETNEAPDFAKAIQGR